MTVVINNHVNHRTVTFPHHSVYNSIHFGKRQCAYVILTAIEFNYSDGTLYAQAKLPTTVLASLGKVFVQISNKPPEMNCSCSSSMLQCSDLWFSRKLAPSSPPGHIQCWEGAVHQFCRSPAQQQRFWGFWIHENVYKSYSHSLCAKYKKCVAKFTHKWYFVSNCYHCSKKPRNEFIKISLL